MMRPGVRLGQDAHCDVLILGSGAAALSCALRAAVDGLDVLVVEKSGLWGGTSAMSGAGAWIPGNRHARAAGVADDPETALAYIRAVAPEGWAEEEDPLWRAFVEAAPRMLDLLETRTPIRFEILSEPDPILEAPGAVMKGRMLSPAPLPRAMAGAFAGRLRRSTQPHDLTYEEMIWAGFVHAPVRAYVRNGAKILARRARGLAAQGSALMTGLLSGCLDTGNVRLALEARAMSPIMGGPGRVAGALVRQDDLLCRVSARLGVVIATGGFEWDHAMYREHFPEPLDFLCSPSTNTGDGQKFAREAGARLARMDQANIAGALPTRYEGRIHGMPLRFQANPHAIVVDKTARRFGDEYDFNFGEALLERGPDGESRLPAWVIGDADMLRSAPVVGVYARRRPGWMKRAPTLKALATACGLDAAELDRTVERFNRFARQGRDDDFHRGESGYDRLIAGKAGALAEIRRAPFVAMPFNISLMGTKGGPRTTPGGQVVDVAGRPISGLYAAGNAMANPFGSRAVGTGTTIGPVLTWGFICAESLARANSISLAKGEDA